MERDVHVMIDIPVARKMLILAGWGYDEIRSSTGIEIIEKVLEQIDCSGVSFDVKEECV